VIRHADRWVALALLAIALMLFAPVVAQPGGLIYPPNGDFTDLTITHWPNAEFTLASLRATSRLPLWRPTIMSGAPFAANPLSGLFYFPHAVLLFLPLAIGFNVLFIAHVWLAGCGAYALLRAWKIDRPAAFVGGLAWMATPRMFAHVGAGHVGMVEAVAWMPLVMWAAHRLALNRRVMDGIWLGAVWAVQFLADPRTSFYSVGLSLAYILAVVFGDRISKRPASFGAAWRPGILGALCAVLAFAVLGAMLWVPFAEFIAQSNRGALTLAEAGEWSLPVRQLVSLFIADWGGFHEWTVYVGILPLMLAIAGCGVQDAGCRMQDARWQWQQLLVTRFLLLALVVAALFSLGTNGPLFPILFRLLPGLTFLRVPPRAWFIVAFAVAMLCAFGVQAMTRQEMTRELPRPRAWVTLVGVALGTFALLFGLGGFWLLQGNRQADAARAAMLHLALVAPVSISVVLLRARGRIGPRVFATASAVVIAVTLWPVDLSLYRVVSEARAFSERADVAAWLAAQPGTFRTYSPSYSLPQHVAQRAELEMADGVDPMQVASYANVMRAATGARAQGYSVTIPAFGPRADVRQALRDVTPDARLLGRLNVRYVVADFPVLADGLAERARFGATVVYENERAYPRAFVEGGAAGNVTVNEPDRVVVEADGPGTLTLSQVYYPGWHASIDGQPAPIQMVESLMQVNLEAGRHVVEFVFAPWTVRTGLLVSGAGWGGLLVVGLVCVSSLYLGRRRLRWNRVAE
jgi:Bacterial membrane protein YfhO